MEDNIKKAILGLGCEDPVIAAQAALLHLHLNEELLLHDIELCFNNELKIVYLMAKRSKSSPAQIFIPHSVNNKLDLERVENIQKTLNANAVNIALIEADSTIVIYNLESGIIPIENPAELNRDNGKNERRHFIEKELKKRKSSILATEKEQTVIDDD